MQMDRRGFLTSAAVFLAGAPAVLSQRSRRPNVLFILPDEWREQATGYNGDTNAMTPVLDRFAAQSVNLVNAVAGTPVCCPYRGSLLTGQYPLTNGVFINDVELKPKGTTLGEAFAKAGYRTGYIGKWHVYGSPDGEYGRRLLPVPADKRFGFDYWKACECTHEYNHSLYYEGNDSAQRYWNGYDAIAQTDDACGFIGQYSKTADPYFLVLSLGPPHFPYGTAPEAYRKRYESRDITFRPNVPEALRQRAEQDLLGYYAHIAVLDDCLDRLLRALYQTGTAEDTVVVFTSDHGDMMLSQGLTTKLYPWDESIRVPFLVRYPRRLGPRGRHVRTPINAPDIMPTLLGLCGIRVPDGVEGTNFAGLLAGAEPPPGNHAALLSLPVPITEVRKYGFAEYRGLRTERYTYVRSIHGPWLLYDNERDPFQMHNVCGRSDVKQIQARLNRDLEARLRALNDDFLPAAEYVRRADVGHYREVNRPIGYCRSPWGDWESTMSAK